MCETHKNLESWTFRVPLKPSTFPSSTCIDLLWVIRAQALMVWGPYWNCSISSSSSSPFYSKVSRIFEGPNMLKNSQNFAHTPELANLYICYGFQKWVWQNVSIASASLRMSCTIVVQFLTFPGLVIWRTAVTAEVAVTQACSVQSAPNLTSLKRSLFWTHLHAHIRLLSSRYLLTTGSDMFTTVMDILKSFSTC